ncbi:hypothetical protein DH2020_043184 [Rehmannia glutinosa]|uniref:Endopeptidase S2P n=1 Tax=Rehmannia glutinosa TaxID=99300 RepID=A0ABR0UKB9_REHGL
MLRRAHARLWLRYCDFKFLAFNEPLFRFGRRNSRFLRVWFSMGIGFSLATLLGVTIVIVCEVVRAPLVYVGNNPPGNSLAGLSSLIAGLSISLPSMGYVCISSVICVIVHEFGHALAAASEGVQMEYFAIFWAVLFPGALVAFNDASLQSLPGLASLRIYCAGIWHNAAVLDVPTMSPLSGYLSPHDIIFSLDDFHIRTAEEWKQVIALLTEQTHMRSSGPYGGIVNVEKGYCVPRSLIEESTHLQFEGNRTICPSELIAFAYVTCLDVSKYNDGGDKNNYQEEGKKIHCLDAKDVIKLRKCAYNTVQSPRNRNNCLCSEVESCLTPVQLPGLGWVEITYSSLQCHNHGRSLFSDKKHSSSGESSCIQTFVFIGDLISMAHSIHLTSYQPRWSIYFAAYLPNLLEKLLTCAFHVSLVLALLNSLPVYFLDGESILEVTVNYFSSLSSRMKQLILRCCLLVPGFVGLVPGQGGHQVLSPTDHNRPSPRAPSASTLSFKKEWDIDYYNT